MVKVRFLAQVDVEKCKGCGKCAAVCPTISIAIKNKIAVIDENKCLACQNCTGICPEGAITKIPRPVPIILGVDYKSVDQDRILEICRNANIHPMQWLCLCTATRAREGAAAIIKGAQTPEQIALMTGVRAGCTTYCTMMSMRLLKGAGVEFEQQKGHRWYKTMPTLWEVPPEVMDKYPGYFLEEDKDVFRKF